MRYSTQQSTWGVVLDFVRGQHGVVGHGQLLRLELHPQAVKHWIGAGRLHPIRRAVYAVGRPEVSRLGTWMAAVLACGDRALLSHESAAALCHVIATIVTVTQRLNGEC